MRTLIRISTLALLAAAVIAATPTSSANCGTFSSFDLSNFAFTGNCTAGYCVIVSPAATAPSDFSGAFWALTAGNPAVGDGVPANGRDNGACTPDLWLFPDPLGTPNGWGFYTNTDGCAGGSVLTDNCIDSDANAITADKVMIALCDNGGNWMLAATTQAGNGGPADSYFDLDGPGITGYTLLPTPGVVVTASSRLSSTSHSVSFTAPTLAQLSAAYTDVGTATPASSVITGVRVYTKTVARDVALDGERRVGPGSWVLAAGPIAPGAGGNITVNCATNSDTYVGVEPVFEGATPFSSGCITAGPRLVQCGPVLADPQGPGFKRIEKPVRRQQ